MIGAAAGCRQKGCSNRRNVQPVRLPLASYCGLDESTTLASLPPLYERHSGKNPDQAQPLCTNRAAQTAGDETALETHQHHEASLRDKAHGCGALPSRHTRTHTPPFTHQTSLSLSCDAAQIIIIKLCFI